MELICEKYRETVPEQQARCLRPREYCKFRSSCIINLIGRERDRKSSGAESPESEKGKDKDA